MPSPAKTADMIASRLAATQTKTASYTFAPSDNNKVTFTNIPGATTFTLPAVASKTGQSYTLSLGASAAGATITWTCQTGEKIGDGAATGTMVNGTGGAYGDCASVVSDGTRWVVTQKGGTWTVT